MENEKLEILIVEDKESHLADAKEFFGKVKGEAEAEIGVAYASTLEEAEEFLDAKHYDAIISDIFFPTGKTGQENDALIAGLEKCLNKYANSWKYADAMKNWVEGNIPPPSGVYIAKKAVAEKIPCVFNTDTHHHGSATEPINRWSGSEECEIMIIDSENYKDMEGQSPRKNWKKAYAALAAMLEGMEAYSFACALLLPERITELEQNIRLAKEKGLEEFKIKSDGMNVTYKVETAEKNLQECKERLQQYKPIFDKYGIK
jgi:CheY-like chemotaxis protein